MKNKVSLKDIAKEANVSTATVSYALNNREGRISPAMAKHIKAIAKKLNYRPDYLAKSLKTRKTNTIGLIVADINYRFTSGITRAIEAEAKKNNYTVLIGSSDEDPAKFKELVNVLVDRHVDGLILLPVENSDKEIRQLNDAKIPFVLLDRYYPSINNSYIVLDNYKATYDAVDYLAALEHTHIAFINYKTDMFHLQERDRGFQEALKKNKLPSGAKWNKKIERESFEEDLQKAIKQILNEPAKKAAIIFATDTLAIKGIKYLTTLKKKIPGDISVLSFDESEVFELFPCPVTHGKQPLEEMGILAVQTLLSTIDNNKVIMQVVLKSDFVVGKSCGEKT